MALKLKRAAPAAPPPAPVKKLLLKKPEEKPAQKSAPSRPAIPSDRTRVPTIYHQALAGITLDHALNPGPGQKALDALCKERGWDWGLAYTYFRDEGGQTKQCVAVIVGTIVEGSAEMIPGSAINAARAWNLHDEALGSVVDRIRKEHG